MRIHNYKSYIKEAIFKFKGMNYGNPNAGNVGDVHFGKKGDPTDVPNANSQGPNQIENRMVYSDYMGKYYSIDEFNNIVRNYFLKFGNQENMNSNPSTVNLDYMLKELEKM